MKTSHKLALIGTLYVSEGLPFGFFTQALPVLLRQSGLSLTQIGFASLLALPWALKFMWAPMVDHNYSARFGQRKSWIIPAQLLTAAVLAWTAVLSPATDMALIFVVVALCNLFAATLDIATDALAVRLLSPAERGIGNGVQVAGYRIGMVISGGLLLIVFEQLGWALSFIFMAGLILLLTVPIFLYREPIPQVQVPTSKWSWSYFKQPGVMIWLGVILFYKLGDALGAGMIKPFMVDSGMTLAEIGWLIGTVGFAASLAGALLGGFLTSRFGHNRSMIAFGLLQVVGIIGYVMLAAGHLPKPLIYAIVTFENFAGGMATAAIFTMMMDACRKGSEGTDYTIQSCVFIIATGAATAVSGWLAQSFGYTSYFTLSAATALIAISPFVLAALGKGFLALQLNRLEQSEQIVISR
ncbi:MFS transporter [Stenotrophobium rhamnosiphilum]|uniref:MFS transporter n=1 Tax=Stenotrophobium rhamnosiphilum TaxID=2029166 RepID=A0A2T5MB22_9GAMM|nr:MFS transporter [Stenotrophobium rhamnosiphilum]PTU27712.1 MFS transporter [Stenotrophobium rhamnosiphilum]